MSTDERLVALRQQLEQQVLDALLVTAPENRSYLTGFFASQTSLQGSVGWLLVGQDLAQFITSFLYYDAVRAQVTGLEAVEATSGVLECAIATLEGWDPSRIGFESQWLTHEQYQRLIDCLGKRHELVPTSGLIEGLRQVKDGHEIAAIGRAVALTDRACEYILAYLREEQPSGVSEREVAWRLERFLREHGAEGMAFDPAVASGPHSAVPHHTSTDRHLAMGEPIWIDFGARIDGYCADLTRSFCIGQADSRFSELYDLVLRAQVTALRGIKPDLTGQEADALARDVIVAAGYADAFGHSLGHGVGLAVHEAPRLSRLGTEPLRPGMVTTVEPGVYLRGWGGIRIEDLGVITADGFTVLSIAEKRMVI